MLIILNFIRVTTIMLKWILILAIAINLINTRILEVTLTNLQSVLKMQTTINILFHHPQSQKSHKFKQMFYQTVQNNIKDPKQNFGLIDCQQQAQLCRMAIRLVPEYDFYPKILRTIRTQSENYRYQGVNEWQFLLSIANNSSEVLKNQKLIKQAIQISKCLSQPNKQCVIVLQQEGLPILDKVQALVAQKESIFYLQPSKLSEKMISLIGKSYGCWILNYSNNQLKRYSCGLGDTSQQVLQNLKLFKSGKANRFIISTNDNQFKQKQDLSYQQLTRFLDEPKQWIIYFYSKDCRMCFRAKDIELIKMGISTFQPQTKQEGKKIRTIRIFSYNIDQNQLPASKLRQLNITISKVPTVLMFDITKDGIKAEFQVAQLQDVINIGNIKKMIQQQFSKLRKQKEQEINTVQIEL